MLEQWSDGGATLAVTYTIGDDIITEKPASPMRKHLLYDGHGSVRQAILHNGSINEAYSYDAYGVMLGGNPTPSSPAATSLLYAGEYFDTDLQQYYLRARYYDQNTGRFNRIDPLLGKNYDPQSLHKYNYVHNNPVNGVDPSGRFFSTPYHGRRVEEEFFVSFAVFTGVFLGPITRNWNSFSASYEKTL